MSAKVLRLAPDLTLPLDAVSRTFGILAVRGAGKSNTAAVMAEEMFKAGLPFVVIDPVGSWYGLRSSADGKTPGLPIPIFGGKHGDVPIERGGGEVIADLIVEKRLTCVLDLSRADSESAKKQFLLAFASRLYQKNENPLHLFLEEADDYIPQKPMRDEAQLLRAWENIVRRGRARGLGMTLITQRSAAVAKMVLTQVETLFAMRTTGPQDIAAIEAWVKYHQVGKDVLSTLAGLNDGEAWVWSPHYLKTMSRHQIRRRTTFDSGATPANVKANDTRPPATLADIDLSALQERMKATIEKAKADDPRELRKQIAALKLEVANQLKVSVQNAEKLKPGVDSREKIKEKPVLTDADRALLEKLVKQLAYLEGDTWHGNRSIIALGCIQKALDDFKDAWRKDYTVILEDFHKRLESKGLQKILGKLATLSPAPPTHNPQSARTAPRSPLASRVAPGLAQATSTRPARQVSAPDGMTGPELKILTSLAELEVLGRHPADKQQLGLMAGYTNVRSGGFSEPLGRLVAAGHVVSPRTGELAITESGRAIAGPVTAPASSAELQARILDKLTGPERKLLHVLIAEYPNAVTKEWLGEQCGYTNIRSGGFSEPLGHLNTLGLVESPDRGAVVASAALFLES